MVTNLNKYKVAFNSVGWFIPPYTQRQFLDMAANKLAVDCSLDALRVLLTPLYSPENMAAMIVERYPFVPYICEYKEIISESAEAHFLGLKHVAVSGLMPVIEGVGRKVAKSRGLNDGAYIKTIFKEIACSVKAEYLAANSSVESEIASMMDSFIEFTSNNLYIDSKSYQLSDKTNRHGILHGAYADIDYGDKLNFYKAIGAVDFLCFVVSMKTSGVSLMAAAPTPSSTKTALRYLALQKLNG